jgi:hypothetical protein
MAFGTFHYLYQLVKPRRTPSSRATCWTFIALPSEKEKLIQKFAKKAGTTETAVILSAVDEKLGLTKNREQTIRELAGWLSHEEAAELREAVEVFSQNHEGDWK